MTAFNISAPAYFADRDVAIYYGDCQTLLNRIPSESVDLVLTDPPYLVSYRGRWCSDWDMIKGDDDPSWVLPVFIELWRVLKPNSLCLSFYGWPHADLFLTAWKLIGFRPVSQIVCVKDNIGLGYFSRSQHESAFLLAKGNPPRPAVATSDVIVGKREHAAVHPNQKPLDAIARLIASYTKSGATVLDPFMGSGTTLVAARNLGRRAIGIEIEEQYCRAALDRLAQQVFDFEPRPAPSSRTTAVIAGRRRGHDRTKGRFLCHEPKASCFLFAGLQGAPF
jgi:site-specific DNA-methyltransferase (adenine-specific)